MPYSREAIDKLVADTKEYVAEPKYRVKLADLMAGTVKNIIDALDSAKMPVRTGEVDVEFIRQIEQYESIVEPLIRVVGVLGRWASDNTVDTVTATIRAMVGYANKERSGLTVLLNLRSYPAVLLTTGYGIGLVDAHRWSALHRLLSETIHNPDHADPSRVVDSLFLNAWAGYDHRLWQMVEGMERHKTPLSDRLCDLFGQWSTSFTAIVPDYEELYETWEIAGCLVYAEKYAESELSDSVAGNLKWGTWVPFGRSAWHTRTRERILDRLGGSELNANLLDAGFCRGDKAVFHNAVKAYLQICHRVEWR